MFLPITVGCREGRGFIPLSRPLHVGLDFAYVINLVKILGVYLALVLGRSPYEHVPPCSPTHVFF